MEYGLPKFKKFPVNSVDNIKLSVENFHKCPEKFKEELATNIYIASLREEYEIDGNEELFRYVDFNNENCVASLSVSPTTSPNDDNKYIDEEDIDDDDVILTEANNTMNKRKNIENLINKFFLNIDITGENAKKYKEMFSKMTDEQFNKYMKKFLYDDSMNFYLEVLPNKNEPTFKQIKKCADLLGVPLDEYVYYRHDGDKDNPTRTAYRVPVGYLILKRMQQTLSKKNTYSLSISSRNMKTGQKSAHYYSNIIVNTLLIAGTPLEL